MVEKGFVNVDKKRPGNTFALLKVCRQIYAESRLLIYSKNTFNLSYFAFFFNTWYGRSILTQAQLEAVHSIVLDEGRLYFFDGWCWTVP
jgi:hypothetical protein